MAIDRERGSFVKEGYRYEVSEAPEVTAVQKNARKITLRTNLDLGLRLIQSQNAKAVASATPERKLAASLSYRVATRRKSLSRQKAFSMRCRPR